MRYHLGCASNYLEGYVNVDFPKESQEALGNIKADIYDNILTMEMDRCSEIRCNIFNSFNYVDSLYLLYKWYFALMPNGLLRITTIDLESTFNILQTASTERSFRIIRSLYGSHKSNWSYNSNGWTQKTLTYVMEKIGFLIYKVEKRDDADNFNCIIELCSILGGDRRRKSVIKNIHELFKLYKNNETELEAELEKYYIKQFDRRVELFG